MTGHRMPVHGGACNLCGEPLGLSYWVHDRHLRVHDHCRPWHEVPFPFSDKLRDLRRRWKISADPVEKERLREAGVWLRQRARMWPDGALETVREVKARGL